MRNGRKYCPRKSITWPGNRAPKGLSLANTTTISSPEFTNAPVVEPICLSRIINTIAAVGGLRFTLPTVRPALTKLIQMLSGGQTFPTASVESKLSAKSATLIWVMFSMTVRSRRANVSVSTVCLWILCPKQTLELRTIFDQFAE